mmetsp:Transcript_1091/g.7038  ORF Transcript_1091/g.7038 Transcript_1091/m.7038 type:complete len:319 (+) Transcript_1091:907-1863(+)
MLSDLLCDFRNVHYCHGCKSFGSQPGYHSHWPDDQLGTVGTGRYCTGHHLVDWSPVGVVCTLPSRDQRFPRSAKIGQGRARKIGAHVIRREGHGSSPFHNCGLVDLWQCCRDRLDWSSLGRSYHPFGNWRYKLEGMPPRECCMGHFDLVCSPDRNGSISEQAWCHPRFLECRRKCGGRSWTCLAASLPDRDPSLLLLALSVCFRGGSYWCYVHCFLVSGRGLWCTPNAFCPCAWVHVQSNGLYNQLRDWFSTSILRIWLCTTSQVVSDGLCHVGLLPYCVAGGRACMVESDWATVSEKNVFGRFSNLVGRSRRKGYGW